MVFSLALAYFYIFAGWGLILGRFLKLTLNSTEKVLFVFCSSGIFVYTVSQLYALFAPLNRGFFLTLAILQLAIVAWIYRANIKSILLRPSRGYCQIKLDGVNIWTILAIVWLADRLRPFYTGITNALSEPFMAWDAVVSWNRWAYAWLNGTDPSPLYHYPQLAPLKYAQVYLFSDSLIEAFAKVPIVVTFLLTLYVIFRIFDALTLNAKIFSVGFVLLIIHQVTTPLFFSGYVDAFVLCGGIWSYYIIKSSPSAERFLLLFVIATWASLIKQAGLFLYLPLCIYFFKNRGLFRFERNQIRLLLILSAIPLITYLVLNLRTHFGLDSSEIGWVTSGIYRGASMAERFEAGMLLIFNLLGYWTIPIVFGIIFSFANATQREKLFFSFFPLPMLFLWSLFFSYDVRNLYSVVGVVAIWGSAVWPTYLFQHLLPRVPPIPTLVIVSILALQANLPEKPKLIEKQEEKKMEIGNLQLNLWLATEDSGTKIAAIEYPFSKYINQIQVPVTEKPVTITENLDLLMSEFSGCKYEYLIVPKNFHCELCQSTFQQFILANQFALYKDFNLVLVYDLCRK